MNVSLFDTTYNHIRIKNEAHTKHFESIALQNKSKNDSTTLNSQYFTK